METVIVTEILTMKQEKAIEQELDCEFIRIDPNKKHFDILKLSIKYLETSNNRLIN